MGDNLSISRLESFLLVADSGGYGPAAPGNNVRQSQLHRQVKELEEHFGKPLLERRGRGSVKTPAGQRLSVVVREMLLGLEEVRKLETDAQPAYRLGAGDSLLQWWVVRRVGQVRKRVAGAVASLVSLSTKDVVAWLDDARLDFGLVRANEVPKALRARPLGVLHYALYVPRKLLPKEATRNPVELLSLLPLALQQSEPALDARLRALALERGGLRVELECETFPQAAVAVRSGGYAAVLPTIVKDDLHGFGVEEVRLPGMQRLSVGLHLAWHPRTTRNPRLARLADALEECLRLEAR